LPVADAFPSSTTNNKSYLLIGKNGIITEPPFGGINTSAEDNSGITISAIAAVSGEKPAMLVFDATYDGI